MANAQSQAARCTTKVFQVKGMAIPAKLSPAAARPTYPIWVASVSSFCCSCVFALRGQGEVRCYSEVCCRTEVLRHSEVRTDKVRCSVTVRCVTTQ